MKSIFCSSCFLAKIISAKESFPRTNLFLMKLLSSVNRIPRMKANYLSLPQKLLVKRTMMVKSSSLPMIMRALRNSFSAG